MKEETLSIYCRWFIAVLAILSLASTHSPAQNAESILSSSASPALRVNLVVNSNDDADDGNCDGTHCSLREAINAANSTTEPDIVTFQIGATSSQQTIQPSSQLPIITEEIIIDGFSQSCANCIELDGSLQVFGDGLQITASNSLIQGLTINRFPDDGIQIFGSEARGNTISQNHIGTNVAANALIGEAPRYLASPRQSDPKKKGSKGDSRLLGSFGNSYGVYLTSGASNTVIQGNTISGNQNQGILINSTNQGGDLVEDNWVGTNAAGLNLGNSAEGVSSHSNDVTFVNNVVAWNRNEGIQVEGTSLRNRISGNSIYSNGLLGIEIGSDGSNTNDQGDPDSGANNLQNNPHINEIRYTSVGSLIETVTVLYEVSSSLVSSSYPLIIEFYISDSSGSGKTFIGSDLYESGDAEQVKTLVFTPIVPLLFESRIVAVATDSEGNSSEFSSEVTLRSGQSLYWISAGSGLLQVINKDGIGYANTLYQGLSSGAGRGIYVDEFNSKVYWIDGDQILSGNINGASAATILYDVVDGVEGARGLEVDAARSVMYWANQPTNEIMRAPADGSGPVEVLFNETDGVNSPLDLELDKPGGRVYWSNNGNGEIMLGPQDGSGSPTVLFNSDPTNISFPRNIELDLRSGMIYWDEGGVILRANLDGDIDSVEKLFDLILDDIAPSDIALDLESQKIYWTSAFFDEIERGKMNGKGSVENIVSLTSDPSSLMLGQIKEDLVIHAKRPLVWGPLHIEYSNTFPDIGETLSPEGRPMVEEGCGWYSYLIRGSDQADVVIRGSAIFQTLSKTTSREVWSEAPASGSDPGFVFDAPLNYASCTEGVDLSVKVFLHGPYDESTDLMQNDLQANSLIPYFQPFSSGEYGYNAGPPQVLGSPIEYYGPESGLELQAGDEIVAVDWVLVELRTDPSNPLSTVARRAGVLLESGVISDPFSMGPLKMPLPPGSYHIVVRHRNSLAIMSASPVSLTATSPAFFDFTSSQTQAFGINPMTQVDSSPVAFAMRGADGNLSGDTSAFDFLTVWLPANGGPLGYTQADFNISGDVSAFDFLNVFLPNNGQSSQVPD